MSSGRLPWICPIKIGVDTDKDFQCCIRLQVFPSWPCWVVSGHWSIHPIMFSCYNGLWHLSFVHPVSCCTTGILPPGLSDQITGFSRLQPVLIFNESEIAKISLTFINRMMSCTKRHNKGINRRSDQSCLLGFFLFVFRILNHNRSIWS